MHFGRIDDEGHAHGARSPRYAEAARDGAAFAARYAASLDLSEDALIVISDHGHVARGGHGGDEPEVQHALFLAGRPALSRGRGARRAPDARRRRHAGAGPRRARAGLGARPADDGCPSRCRRRRRPARWRRRSIRPRASPAGWRPRPRARASRPSPRAAGGGGNPAALSAAGELHATLSRELDRKLEARREAGARLRLGGRNGRGGGWRSPSGPRSRERARVERAAPFRGARSPCPSSTSGSTSPTSAGIGYRPGFSFLSGAPVLVMHATPGAVLAVAFVSLFASRFRPGPAGPWVLLLGTAIPFALLVAWVGWDPVTPPPSVAGAAVFQLAPAVISAACGAVLSAILARRPAAPP